MLKPAIVYRCFIVGQKGRIGSGKKSFYVAQAHGVAVRVLVMGDWRVAPWAAQLLVILSFLVGQCGALSGFSFVRGSKTTVPNLILVSGCTGSGKSTFGMEVAIQKGILKCISTDTIRQTMRTFDKTPALHRSSFQGEADPIVDWRESCSVLEAAIENIVLDCARRGTSLVLEGVHIVPSRGLIDKWNEAGGLAVGAVLTIPDPEVHRNVIFRRGEQTGKGAEAQITKFNRIRSIHDEMLRLGKELSLIHI